MDSLVLSAAYSEELSAYAPHYHDCHQLIYIVTGSAEAEIGGKSYTARSGTLLLISRLEQHSIRVTSPDYHRYTLRISPQIFEQEEDGYLLFSVLVNRPESFCHAVAMSGVEEILTRLVGESKESPPMSGRMTDSLLYQLLISLYRTAPKLFADTGTGVVRQLQHRFETDYAESYTLKALAQEYHLSAYYLSHLFKKATGYSVMNHLNSCRLAAAKKYLAKTDMDIAAIVARCGFSDTSNFSRTFKKHTGLTPSGFRKKYQI